MTESKPSDHKSGGGALYEARRRRGPRSGNYEVEIAPARYVLTAEDLEGYKPGEPTRVDWTIADVEKLTEKHSEEAWATQHLRGFVRDAQLPAVASLLGQIIRAAESGDAETLGALEEVLRTRRARALGLAPIALLSELLRPLVGAIIAALRPLRTDPERKRVAAKVLAAHEGDAARAVARCRASLPVEAGVPAPLVEVERQRLRKVVLGAATIEDLSGAKSATETLAPTSRLIKRLGIVGHVDRVRAARGTIPGLARRTGGNRRVRRSR